MSEPTRHNLVTAGQLLSREQIVRGRPMPELTAEIAMALDEAELRGHHKAVSETAILSIHKAVAAERERVIADILSRLAPRALGVTAGTLVKLDTIYAAIDAAKLNTETPK